MVLLDTQKTHTRKEGQALHAGSVAAILGRKRSCKTIANSDRSHRANSTLTPLSRIHRHCHRVYAEKIIESEFEVQSEQAGFLKAFAGPSAARMRQPSLHGWIHGVSSKSLQGPCLRITFKPISKDSPPQTPPVDS